ncbi:MULTISPECIES: sigma 54-interacting transcriptional regulator [unclassified Pseudodesulfovibrio]|uniref:sigma-54 interaction domain-containing protein n=1 Tax=unclassified Pseudodesulfovibrio TaxID=2661612 RepID=UPI000FEC1FE9|nr:MULTISPECIES: sigma 54-interacting transcriptional regulator [unclassified Pseudodesulfovibrio]MCJ2165368.1 sigma 54-interacting transcriptional regulator [Pseudodesulfovibrio sp. S3-i]RWU02831.1 PAS domain-containing protein [Pseudodesulfovibrio sp. S3]
MPFPANLPLEDVFASIADGLFTVDTEWNVTYFNEAAQRITGISAKEALGRKCWDVFRSSLCDGQCAIGNCIEKGGLIVNKSIFIVRSDGSTLPISISASPLKDKEGNVIGGVETFRDLTEIHAARQQARDIYRFENIVGRSQGLEKIFRILPQISDSEATTLLLGESGTGKELFAKAIHNLSSRKHGPFVAVNCGALPDTLLESELFGYKAGAFTDARADKPGRFELADGGTVFLDEIGDIPSNLQVKLLRFLQDKTFEPLGGVTPVKADVRVVAATNKNLEQAVAEGSFRQDLYYRLNVVTLTLPPLSQRQEDLPLLIDHFLEEFNAIRGKAIKGVSEDALHVLMRHDFPGNVRELENILEYAFILCPSGFIQVEHLPEHFHPGRQDDKIVQSLSGTMDAIKRRAARQAVERNNGKKMAACRELGITKDTLRRLLTAATKGE